MGLIVSKRKIQGSIEKFWLKRKSNQKSIRVAIKDRHFLNKFKKQEGMNNAYISISKNFYILAK